MAAKVKLIVTGHCRFEGKYLEKGTVIEVDPGSKAEMQRLAPLNAAERLATWSPEVEKAIQTELVAEEKAQKLLDEKGKPAPVKPGKSGE